jgi:hypothetical protein
MAGTGWPWEVVNFDKVAETLAALAGGVDSEEGRAWFLSPHVVRHVTGPTFVNPVSGDTAREAVARCCRDDGERAILLAKLAAGGDLRVFVPAFLSNLGPDFRHIADWIASLPRTDPRMLRKLHKVTVTAATTLAGRWSRALSARAARAGAASGGEVLSALRLPSGHAWVELRTGADLAAESAMMSHCVHSYAPRLERGTRIFSLRDHRGDAKVTVEILPTAEGGAAAGQIRGFGNRRPPAIHRPDVAALLDHLGVGGDLWREASAMGLVLDRRAGAWTSVAAVAERVEIGGVPGLGIDGDVHVPSPVCPDEFIAVVSGPEQWWRGGGEVRVAPCGARRMCIEEQREVVRLVAAVHPLSGPGDNPCRYVPPSYLGAAFGFVVVKDGAWSTFVDACEEWEIGGVPCLAVGDSILVPRRGDKADILLTVVPSEKGGLLVTRPLEHRRDWAAAEVRDVAAVLDALAVDLVGNEDGGLREAGLSHKWPGGWARFQDWAERRPWGGPPPPDGRALEWQVAPWLAVLRDDRGKSLLAVRFDSEGRTRGVDGLPSDPAQVADAARLLNDMGAAVGPDWFDRHSPSRWFTFGYGEAKTTATLLCLGGRWQAPASEAEAIAALARIGKRQFRDPSCREAALRLLPAAGTDDKLDAVLAGHLAAWAKAADADTLQAMRHGYAWGEKKRPRATAFERLSEAAALLGRMEPPARRACARAAATYMRGLMGASRSPAHRNACGGLFAQDEVRKLVVAYAAALPPKFLDRAVPWALWVGDICLRDERRLDARWLDLADALPPGRARAAIAKAANSSLWRLRGEDAWIPATPGDAVQWARAIRLAVDCWWTTWADEAADTIAAAAADGGPAWAAAAEAAEAARPRRRAAA